MDRALEEEGFNKNMKIKEKDILLHQTGILKALTFRNLKWQTSFLPTSPSTGEIFKAKKRIFKKTVLFATLLADAAGLVPVPWSIFVTDLPLVTKEIKDYVKAQSACNAIQII